MVEGTTSFAELYAFTLNTDVDTLHRAYKEHKGFRTELNKAFLGEVNCFDKEFKKWKAS